MDYVLEKELIQVGIDMIKSLADEKSSEEDRRAAYHTILELLSPYKKAES